jgi:hypothetical protein
MMSGRATRAIARRSFLRRFGLLESVAALAAACGAFLWFPGSAMLLGTVGIVAVAFASVGRNNVAELRNLRYFSAPLYGREVARALAIAPCANVIVFTFIAASLLAIVIGTSHALPSDAWPRLAAFVLAQLVAVLVALSGCLRDGGERWLYVGLATIAGVAIEVVGAAGTLIALSVATFAAAAIGFVALRALGETLARYDPLGAASSRDAGV